MTRGEVVTLMGAAEGNLYSRAKPLLMGAGG